MALGTYNGILGMDWLEAHKPMMMDWRAKYLEFSMDRGLVCLRGHEANYSTYLLINNVQFQSLCKNNAFTHVVHLFAVATKEPTSSPTLACLQSVLEEFSDVFGEPVGLPPRRSCDHRIPLILGALPFSIRPYRQARPQK